MGVAGWGWGAGRQGGGQVDKVGGRYTRLGQVHKVGGR